MIELKSKKVPGLVACTAGQAGISDALGNPIWVVTHAGSCYRVADTADNRAAARKKLLRMERSILNQSETSTLAEKPKLKQASKSVNDRQKVELLSTGVSKEVSADTAAVAKYAPKKLNSLVQGLYAKQTTVSGTWTIFFKNTVLRVIDHTQDNREAARRSLRHLEFKTDADLEKLRKEKRIAAAVISKSKSEERPWPPSAERMKPIAKPVASSGTKSKLSAELKPKSRAATKIVAQLRLAGPDGKDSKIFEFGEFVHHANARSRFEKLCAALEALAATYK